MEKVITISGINWSWKSTLINDLQEHSSESFLAIHGSKNYAEFLTALPQFEWFKRKNKYEIFQALSHEDNLTHSREFFSQIISNEKSFVIDWHLLLFWKSNEGVLKFLHLFPSFIEYVKTNYIVLSDPLKILERLSLNDFHPERTKIFTDVAALDEVKLRNEKTLIEWERLHKEYGLPSIVLENNWTTRDLLVKFLQHNPCVK